VGGPSGPIRVLPDPRSFVAALRGSVPIGIGIVGMMLDIIPAHHVGVLIVSPAVVLSVFFVGKYSKPVFKALNSGISERKKYEVTKKEVLDTA